MTSGHGTPSKSNHPTLVRVLCCRCHHHCPGHSRNGKQSLVAAALDERITAVVGSSPGSPVASPFRFSSDQFYGQDAITSGAPEEWWSWWAPTYSAFVPPIFRIFLSHFRLYEVVSLHRCVLPYIYRTILEMLLKLIELCETMGSRSREYVGREGEMPMDGHGILGAIAPRAAAIMTGVQDREGDEVFANEMSVREAGKVYTLLGASGNLSLLLHEGDHHGRTSVTKIFDYFDGQFGRGWDQRGRALLPHLPPITPAGFDWVSDVIIKPFPIPSPPVFFVPHNNGQNRRGSPPPSFIADNFGPTQRSHQFAHFDTSTQMWPR